MSPRLRRHTALHFTLHPIVADRCRSVQRLLEITRFEDSATLGVIRPHSCETVGLQFLPHRQLVAVSAR